MLPQWILQSILENHTLVKIILVKVDERYNILKSLVIGGEMKVELNNQSFCWSLPFNIQSSLLY